MTKILVVDDLEFNLYLLESLLTGHGYEVVKAGNGAEALEAARTAPPDLIISDILMPVMDGFALCREWQQDESLQNIPFIFYTATYTEEQDRELALSLGAERFIIKPTEIEDFMAVIETVLEDFEQKELVPTPPQEEPEAIYYQRYNQALIRRLEAKMLALEEADKRLKILFQASTQLAHLKPEKSPAYYALQALCEIMEYTCGQYFSYDHRGQELRFTEGVGLPADVLEDFRRELVFPLGEERGLVGLVAETRQPLVVEDTAQDPRWVTVDESIRAALFVPVRHDDKLFGVLGLLSRQPGVFSEEDVRNISVLANNVAIAIQNNHLFGELRKVNQAVEQAAEAVVITDTEGNIEYVNPAFENITGYNQAEALGKNLSMLNTGEQPGDPYREMWRTIRDGKLWRGKLLNQKKSGQEYHEEQTIAPIFNDRGEISGFVAIKHDITSRVRAEKATQQHLERIASLRAIDTAINASLNLKVTLDVVLEQVTRHLGVDAASVLLLDPYTHRLEYAAGRGFTTRAIQATSLRMDKGLPGIATMERRTTTVPDLASAGDRYRRAQSLAKETFTSYACTPLIAKGRVKGVLEVFHRSPKELDEDLLHFLKTLAGQAVIAIDNAELFENLQRSNQELKMAYDATIAGWSNALDLRDKDTEGHSQRVTEMTIKIARAMGIDEKNLIHVRWGALLHDLGKLGVPDAILHKPGKLTEEEWAIMRQHPTQAFEMLASIRYLRPALDIPHCHHEKWDGTGYPRGLKEEDIPLAARAFAVVDVWDALTSDRPYRDAWPEEKALAYIKEQVGKHFDPKVVEVFLEVVGQGFSKI